ncbi:MAG: PIG-L family deacetylase [Micropruina sp.]
MTPQEGSDPILAPSAARTSPPGVAATPPAAGSDPFAGRHRVAFAHAHPDDETLATGALIQHLTEAGVAVAVVTATRGEQGEVVPGSNAPPAGSPDLDAHRQGELTAALRALAAEGPFFLGEPPARVPGLSPRRYVDSGMRWLTPTVAGPGEDAGPDSFTSTTVAEAAADLAAFLESWAADLVVSYEVDGGYGHPDHVQMHHVARAAARSIGVPFAEVISIPRDGTPPASDGVTWYDRTDRLDDLLPALHAHASQFTVDGRDAIHSGGQREPLQLRTGVRLR